MRDKFHPEILTESPRVWTSNKGAGRKTSSFLALCVNISKMVGDIAKLLLMNNSKLHMGFLSVPKSMTSDDLELDGGRPPLFSNT